LLSLSDPLEEVWRTEKVYGAYPILCQKTTSDHLEKQGWKIASGETGKRTRVAKG